MLDPVKITTQLQEAALGTMLSMTVSAMSLSPNTVPSVSTQVGRDD